MPRRIVQNTLNASTLDILNVIRQNASYDYQQQVPEITKATDIPKVGEIIYGTPAIANQFLNALVNRIALVRVQSATFNNPYARLKKGYLEFGESIEEIFVNIAKVVEYTPEKAASREFKRTLPDVKSAFHIMNWRVMYPVTIQDEDLKLAFLSIDGVENLIAKIVDAVYTAAEYDEFLLFKYLMIKAISHGKIYPQPISAMDFKDSAVNFRGISNMMTFMLTTYNDAHVKNNTPRNRQVIFMDAMYNAKYDVEILSAAFNMDKAEFMGSLYLIDDWTTFDNERFETIRQNSDGLEEVTEGELSLLKDVKAVIFDENWFQVYDNNNKFTEKYIASGLYWNYFYHTWKTVSWSPFSNAVAFFETNDTGTTSLPDEITITIASVDTSEEAVTMTFNSEQELPSGTTTIARSSIRFVQTEDLTTAGIAVQPYGAVIIPAAKISTDITLVAMIGSTSYTATSTINAVSTVDTEITLSKD